MRSSATEMPTAPVNPHSRNNRDGSGSYRPLAARVKSHAGGVTRPGTIGVTPIRARNVAPRSLRSRAGVARNPLGDGHLRPSALSFVGGDHPDRHPPHFTPNDRRSPPRLPRDFRHGLLAARGKSHAGGVTRPGADGVTPSRSRNVAPRSLRSRAGVARNPLGDGHLRPSALSFVGGDHPDRHPPHSAPSDHRSPPRLPRDFYHGLLTCISHHPTVEARHTTARTSLRLLAVLNVLSSTPARAKRLAPLPDGPLTHFTSPRGEKCRLIPDV